MTLTKNAIGNLINRYRAVLAKCRLLNTLGSLAVAGALVIGGAGVAGATDISNDNQWNTWINGGNPTDDAKVIGNVTTSNSDNINNKNVAITATTGDVTLTINSAVTNVEATQLTGAGSDKKAILTINSSKTLASGKTTAGAYSTINLAGNHDGDVVLDDANAALVGQDGSIGGKTNTHNLTVNNGTVTLESGKQLQVFGKTTLTNGRIEVDAVDVGVTDISAGPNRFFTTKLEILGGTLIATTTAIGNDEKVNVTGGNVLLGDITFDDDNSELITSVNLTVGTIEGDDKPGSEGIVTIKNGATLVADSIGDTNSINKVDATNGNVVSKGDLATSHLLVDNGHTVTAAEDIVVLNGITGGQGDMTLTAGGNISIGQDTPDIDDDITGGTGDVTLSAVNGEIKAHNITTGKDIGGGTYEGEGHITAKTLTLTGDLKMEAFGELSLTGEGADKSTIAGDMELDGVMANVNELKVVKNAVMQDMEPGSQFKKLTVVGTTTIEEDSEVAIGDFNPGAAVTIGSSPDPRDPVDTTVVGVNNFTNDAGDKDTLTVAVDVKRYATLGYGASDMQTLRDSLDAAEAAGAPMDGGVYAASKTLNLDKDQGGQLNIGDMVGMTAANGHANFSFGATLAVDQKALGNNPVFANATDDAQANFANGSNILVANATVADLRIAKNVDVATGDEVKVFNDSNMLTSKLDADKGVVTSRVNNATTVFPSLESGNAGAINKLYARGLNDVDSPVGGIQFLSRATNNRFLGADKARAAKTVEGASRMVATSAPQMAAAANTAGVGAVVARTSIGNLNSSLMAMDTNGNVSGMNAGDSNKVGLGLWIMPLWQSVNSFGQKAGEFKSDMHGNIGGVAIGADYTFENALRAGITFNIGGGYAEGSGDFAKTTNNMNFWGIGLYGSWAYDNFGVTADVNYTSTFNKMKQELDSRMGMADLKSDVYSSAITAGLRGEYKVVTDALDITPHLGVRLMYLHTDEYDVKSAGSKVYKGDAINQTIWSFPVGVQFSKSIELNNGWYVKPSLDLQVTPRAGEVHAKNDIKYTGLNTSASIETQTMDYITYGGAAGIEFGNADMKFGLNYNLEAGAHTTNHGVFGTFRYEF